MAAEPVLGSAGYWLMTVTALFATAGATNSGLYPAAGLCEQMTAIGQFPPRLGRRFGGRAPAGILVTAARRDRPGAPLRPDVHRLHRQRDRAGRVRARHVRPLPGPARPEPTGRADRGRLTTVVVLATFVVTTLVDEPATAIALVAIVVISLALDLTWKNRRDRARTRSGRICRQPMTARLAAAQPSGGRLPYSDPFR